MSAASDDDRHAAPRTGAIIERSPRTIVIGSILTLLGGTLWGLNGTVSKLLMGSYGVSPEWLALMRQLGGGMLFLLCAAAFTPRLLADAVRSRQSWPSFVATSLVCVLLVQVAYLRAIDATNPGTATVLQTLNLLFVLAATCLHGHRLPQRRESIGIALAIVGVTLIATGGNLTALSLSPTGFMWCMLNAASTAALAIMPLKLIARWGSFITNGVTFTLAGLIMLPFVRPWAMDVRFDALGWGLFAFAIVGGAFGAFGLFLAGSLRAGPMRATMLGTIEPVMATASAVLFAGAVFTPTDLTGFALVLAMVFLVR